MSLDTLADARGSTTESTRGASGEPDDDAIHQSLLAGLLSHIGALEERDRKERGPREYLGARNSRFAIFPGSGLKGANPAYLMAGELVETGRLWARQNAAINPEWAERIGAHLVKRTYSEPHWSKKRAAVMAYERVTLYGVTLVADRMVQYGRIDQALSREMFIRHALVYGEWSTHQPFYRENLRLLEEAEELEHRARRRDIVVDEHTLFDFYDARIGPEVVSGAHFDSWWKEVRRRDPKLLTFDPAMLTHDTVEEVRAEDYPQTWESEGLTFPISYVFQPGADDDGLTIDVPVATLNRVEADDFSWNVPGLREELVTDLIRSLPKNLRVSFVPAPNTARAFLAGVPAGDEPLLDALERYLRSTTGVVVPREAWDWEKVPAHLRPTYRVVDEGGSEQARGKDLDALKAPLQPAFDAALAEVASDAGLSATGQTAWTFGTVEESVLQRRAGHEVRGFPAVVDEGTSVGLGVFGSADEADARHRLGVRRLLLLGMRAVDPLAGLDNAAKLGLAGSPYPTVAELVDDLRAAVAGSVVDAHPPARSPEDFDALARELDAVVEERLTALVADVLRVLDAWRQTEKRISGRAELSTLAAMQDMRSQVGRARGPRVRRRGRAGAAAPLPGVPRRRRPPPRAARRPGGPRRPADGAGVRRAGGVPEPGRRAARGTAAGRGAAAGALDARGVPHLAVGTAPRHGVRRLRPARSARPSPTRRTPRS